MNKLMPEENIGESKHAVLEETGIAFDPTTQHMDLTTEEKRRTTALLMAIQAYNNLIIKDADYYIAVMREQGRNGEDGPIIRPATMNAMVVAAMQFDDFISGKLTGKVEETSDESESGSQNLQSTTTVD